jgi:hypothetical protein
VTHLAQELDPINPFQHLRLPDSCGCQADLAKDLFHSAIREPTTPQDKHKERGQSPKDRGKSDLLQEYISLGFPRYQQIPFLVEESTNSRLVTADPQSSHNSPGKSASGTLIFFISTEKLVHQISNSPRILHTRMIPTSQLVHRRIQAPQHWLQQGSLIEVFLASSSFPDRSKIPNEQTAMHLKRWRHRTLKSRMTKAIQHAVRPPPLSPECNDRKSPQLGWQPKRPANDQLGEFGGLHRRSLVSSKEP